MRSRGRSDLDPTLRIDFTNGRLWPPRLHTPGTIIKLPRFGRSLMDAAHIQRASLHAICILPLVAILTITPALPSDCDARMPEMIGLVGEAGELEGQALELFDSLMSSRDDPQRVVLGCAVFARLLPIYERLKPYADRCWVGSPTIQADGMVASIERGLARSRTYLVKAHCR